MRERALKIVLVLVRDARGVSVTGRAQSTRLSQRHRVRRVVELRARRNDGIAGARDATAEKRVPFGFGAARHHRRRAARAAAEARDDA